jgi:hypothetical protein
MAGEVDEKEVEDTLDVRLQQLRHLKVSL